MKCDKTMCCNTATDLLGFRVWAEGMPKESHEPATFYTSIKLCRPCLKASKFDDIAIDQTRSALRGAFAAAGRRAPDFNSAEAVGRPLSDTTLEQLEARGKPKH